MSLKLATLDDAPKVKRLADLFAAESPYKSMTVDDIKSTKVIEAILKNKDSAVCILSMDGDKAVGALVGVTTEILFSHAKIAQELMWYVEPEYRGSRRALKLMEAFEYWAKEIHKVDILQIALIEDPSGKIDKFYTRRGFKPVERFYLKELEH